MRRRAFLKSTALGVVSFAAGDLASMKAEVPSPTISTDSNILPVGSEGDQAGRLVRVVSIGFDIKNPLPLSKIVEAVDNEGGRGVDVIILPETCRGQNTTSMESLYGHTVSAMAEMAKKHHTYIAVPIDNLEGPDRRLNSIVFLDRSGKIACVYNKVFPFWSEYDLRPAVIPGKVAEVYQADFGRVGFATCFDANFPEVWRSLSDNQAELVLWPSAYSAGMSLQAHAINHHYYIVSSTQVPDCIVYDITGDQLLHSSAKEINISRMALDLDRGIYHQNFNLEKRDRLLKEHADDVMQEKWMELEQWFVLKAKRPGVSARELARQYGLEELRHYIERSRTAIDIRRS